LAGGGEYERGLATSPLPSSEQTELGDASENISKQELERMEQVQQQLLVQQRNELLALMQAEPQFDAGTPQTQVQEEQRRQRLELIAQIEKRINEENARPKKRHIMPDTKERADALYYDQLRQKIQERGSRNFPELQGKRLYGELVMSMVIDARGQVVDTKILQSSRNEMLDKRAIAIVYAAAPFEAFGANLKQNADQLVMTSNFNFSSDGLAIRLTTGK
jgi:periplasmic protein TonB